MKGLSLYIFIIFLFLFAGCEDLQKQPPEKLDPLNPIDPQYADSVPSPEEIGSMNVEGPALILNSTDLELKNGYVFNIYLLAKELEDIIGVSACIQFPSSLKVISVSKDSTYFGEGADGMAFYSTPVSLANEKNELTISTTRLGGSPDQGFTGNCPLAAIVAKAINSETITISLKDGKCQFRDVMNDSVKIKNYINITLQIE